MPGKGEKLGESFGSHETPHSSLYFQKTSIQQLIFEWKYSLQTRNGANKKFLLYDTGTKFQALGKKSATANT